MEHLPIQPLHDLVLLKPVEAEEITAGGIIVPESAKERPDEGIVVAKAADATDDVALGDRVIYKKFTGNDIKLAGETYKLIPSGDLLAKYVESDEIPD